MRGARPAGTHHVALGTRQQQLSLHGFLFLFFNFFLFSFSLPPPSFFFFPFFFLLPIVSFFFFFLLKFPFSTVGKRHERKTESCAARIPSCAKGFFFSLFLLLRLYKRLRLTPLETGWLESKLLHPDWTGRLGGTRQARTGEAVWGFRYRSQPPSVLVFVFFFSFLFSFGSFVLLCFGFFWLF